MITTSGGGALITNNEEEWREIMMYVTQYRESYPYYQHEKIGYNYQERNVVSYLSLPISCNKTPRDYEILWHSHPLEVPVKSQLCNFFIFYVAKSPMMFKFFLFLPQFSIKNERRITG